MKALIFQGKNKIEWTETIDPVIIEPTDIIVKIEGFTFSHADYWPFLGKDDSVEPNTIMGHEGVGIITAVGGSVISLKVGDRVAIGCIIHCNNCQWCLKKFLQNVLMVVLFWEQKLMELMPNMFGSHMVITVS